MYKVRLTTLNKSDLMHMRRLMRRPLPNDKWEYYTEINLLETEAEAHAKASPYMQQNLRIEVISYDLKKQEERVIQQLREIQPQQVYEAQRASPAKEKPTLSSTAKTGLVKVGTGFQVVFFFLLAIAPLAGAKGERWDIALLIGVAAIVVFLFGKHAGQHKDKGSQA